MCQLMTLCFLEPPFTKRTWRTNFITMSKEKTTVGGLFFLCVRPACPGALPPASEHCIGIPRTPIYPRVQGLAPIREGRIDFLVPRACAVCGCPFHWFCTSKSMCGNGTDSSISIYPTTPLYAPRRTWPFDKCSDEITSCGLATQKKRIHAKSFCYGGVHAALCQSA